MLFAPEAPDPRPRSGSSSADPVPPEPIRTAGIQLTRRAIAARRCRRRSTGPWLRLLDRLGLSFDSWTACPRFCSLVHNACVVNQRTRGRAGRWRGRDFDTSVVGVMRSPKDFFAPLAVGAPEPRRRSLPAVADDPLLPAAPREADRQAPEIAPTTDILLQQPRGRHPDGRQGGGTGRSGQGRQGDGLRFPTQLGPGSTAWIRRRCSTTSSPLVGEVGDKLDVIMIPRWRVLRTSTTSTGSSPSSRRRQG